MAFAGRRKSSTKNLDSSSPGIAQRKSNARAPFQSIVNPRKNVSDLGPTMNLRVPPSMSSIGPAYALAREAQGFNRNTFNNDEFEACKKMNDKDLTLEIKRSPALGKVMDSNTSQHLIHWCVVTEKPLSIIAICSNPTSRSEKDAKDSQGRTPLHLAVNENLEHITHILLQMEANPNIMDHLNLMPIHLAASIGNEMILKLLIAKSDHINVGGDNGFTALHFAAAGDHQECVRLLLQHKARMLVKSNIGTYPVHTAAKNGSARALEAMMEGAESLGLDHRLLLSLKDKEGQMPIHCAVNNGAAEAVSVCLKYGASMLSEKESGSTPVHYAAKQGNLALLKVMSAFSSKVFFDAVHKFDMAGRTPIHWASMFNHHEVVTYLLKTSDANTFDINNQTPLLSAASGGCWEAMAALLAHKDTNTEVIDLNHRNFLHQAVIHGVDVAAKLPLWRTVPNIKKRCNEQDKTGSTPLHYATWNGNIADVKALLSLGARVNTRNKLRQNPFHIACKNGCYDVVLLLMNDVDGSRLKNEQDEDGQSPLHIAAAKGYAEIVNILLQRGAIISKSKSNSTALHLAAAGDHIPCVHSLLSVHLYLLNMEDHNGNTALHLAATNGHATTVNLLLRAGAEITYNYDGKCFFDDALTSGCRDVLEVCIANDRWDEILSVFSKHHGQLLLGLIRYLPSCCLMVFDRCVTPSSNNKNASDYSVTYNFRHLQLGDEYASFAKTYKLKNSPLYPITLMLEHNRDECLRHELVHVYLQQKWASYGHMMNILDVSIYCLFLGSLTIFVMNHDPLEHYHKKGTVERFIRLLVPYRSKTSDEPQFIYEDPPGRLVNITDWLPFQFDQPWFPKEAGKYIQSISTFDKICLLIVTTYSFALFFKSILQVIMLGYDHLLDLIFYLLDTLTYAASLYFAVPFLLGYSTHIQWEAGAVAVFLAWFNFLVLCQRSSMVGLYIVMYIQIMKTLLQILFIFLVLTIAFGLVFYILMSKEDHTTGRSPILSMYRALILIFEIDYVNTILKPSFDGRSETMHFPFLTFLSMAVYLFLMPLLMVNLMIGLAVGDIQSVLKFAHQQKLTTLVNFYEKIERKLLFFMEWTPTEERLTVKPNETSYRTRFMYELGLKAPLLRKDGFSTSSTSYAAHDRLQPLQRSIENLERELCSVRRNIEQISKEVGVKAENFYSKYPFGDPILGQLLYHVDEVM